MSSQAEDDGSDIEPSAILDATSTCASQAPRLWPWILALGLYGSINFTLSFLRPALDEPIVLRWLRALNEHPVRAVLAVGLLLVGWLGLPPTSTDVARTGRNENSR